MENILKIVLVFVSSLSGFAQDASIIQGQVTGLSGSKLYLYSSGLLGGTSQLVDSVRLSGEFFTFRRQLNEPAGYILSIDDTFGQFYFIWDKSLSISLDADDLNQSVVEGSPVNELLKSFSDTVDISYNQRIKEIRQLISQARQDGQLIKNQQLYEEYYRLARQLNEATVAFIRLHKESWVGLFALLSYHKDLGRKQTLDLLSTLTEPIQKSRLYGQLKEKISDTSYVIAP